MTDEEAYACPNGCDLRAGEIPALSLAEGHYGKWDGVEKRYFWRAIAHVDRYSDFVSHYSCPDCRAVWMRRARDIPDIIVLTQ